MTKANRTESPNRLLLTVEEAAERVGIGRSLAYRMAAEGLLPVVRIATSHDPAVRKTVRIHAGDLMAWIDEQRSLPAANKRAARS